MHSPPPQDLVALLGKSDGSCNFDSDISDELAASFKCEYISISPDALPPFGSPISPHTPKEVWSTEAPISSSNGSSCHSEVSGGGGHMLPRNTVLAIVVDEAAARGCAGDE